MVNSNVCYISIVYHCIWDACMNLKNHIMNIKTVDNFSSTYILPSFCDKFYDKFWTELIKWLYFPISSWRLSSVCFQVLLTRMTSSNGNIFRVPGHLCREFTDPGEFPAQRSVTRSFDFFLSVSE